MSLSRPLSGCRSFQNRACGPGYPVLCFTIWRTTGSTDGGMKSRCSGAPMSRIIKAKISTWHGLRQTSTDFYSFIFYLPFFAAGYPGSPVLRCQSQSDLSVLGAYRTYPEVRATGMALSLLRITAYTMVGTNSISIVTMGASLLSGTACSALFRTNYRKNPSFLA